MKKFQDGWAEERHAYHAIREKNCTINCAIQGVRLIWKQKILLVLTKPYCSLANHNPEFGCVMCTVLHFLHWCDTFLYSCYTFCTPFSANQNWVVFSCKLLVVIIAIVNNNCSKFQEFLCYFCCRFQWQCRDRDQVLWWRPPGQYFQSAHLLCIMHLAWTFRKDYTPSIFSLRVQYFCIYSWIVSGYLVLISYTKSWYYVYDSFFCPLQSCRWNEFSFDVLECCAVCRDCM